MAFKARSNETNRAFLFAKIRGKRDNEDIIDRNMPKKELKNKIVIYQVPSGGVEVRLDASKETIYLTQQQVGELFDVQKAAISKHAKNIFETGELNKKATVSILETVQTEGKRKITRKIEYYNLDLILSIGYRVNSRKATMFRQWATKTLRAHILEGYTLNRQRIAKNYDQFLKAIEQIKNILPKGAPIGQAEVLDLVKLFADTWLSLHAYDRAKMPKAGATKKQVRLTGEELAAALQKFKQEMITQKLATEIFAQENAVGNLAGIVGNVLQAFGRKDIYPTIEEKAAHLLYFMVKNHPFIDGNKRSGALAFVWFLKKYGLLNTAKLTPSALTALTLLIAESDPKDKDKMIGVVLMLLKK